MQHIAFIGLGNMGGPMALNLVRAGYRLSVFDLVPSAVQTLVEAGATAAATAAEAVRREVEAVTAQLVAPIREARRVAMMNMVAAGMAVVAAGLALWASL